ncbi:trichothecene 3-o-acetyltransferase [Fusarium coicis]|nr:trichothecene 3-o-acetyltransferase [Fusarium coicis]
MVQSSTDVTHSDSDHYGIRYGKKVPEFHGKGEETLRGEENAAVEEEDRDLDDGTGCRLQKRASEEFFCTSATNATLHQARTALRDPKQYEWTYEELKAKQFPISAIRGGVIIGSCVFHMVGDATAYLTWTKVWAEECRRIQGLEVSSPVVIDDAMLADRALITGPFWPQQRSPGGSPGVYDSAFYANGCISRDAEHDVLRADRATRLTDQQWISTNDAFSALVWRTAMSVQAPIDSLEDGENPHSVFNIAVDGRKRTDPAVHPQTLGCFLQYISVSAPIREILTTLRLADLAGLIRKEVNLRLNNQFADDVVTLIDQLEDVTRLVPTAFLDVLGKSSVQTSWAEFDLAPEEWGPMLGDRIETIRCPDTGILPGCHVVLPTLPDGGVEVVFGTEGKLLQKVLDDPPWMRFAVPR